jgi:hypothetical protein
MVKNRDRSIDWIVYVEDILTGSNDQYMVLNQTYQISTNYRYFNSTAATSTVFSIGGGSGAEATNANGEDFIAYCFAEVEGYSKFGSYIGNGSSDGPFVYCGFRPAWVMMKSATNAGKWIIQDTTRNPYNRQENIVCAEDTRSESAFASIGATGWIDGLSNGFKVRDSWSDYNTNGNQFIFAAFAENPFGGEGVSPATAR